MSETQDPFGLPPIGPGHNLPSLRDQLAEVHAATVTRVDDLLAGVARVPVIEDDEIAGKVGDFKKQLQGERKKVEAVRVDTKEPYLEASRAVDGFFVGLRDRLDDGLKNLNAKLKVYLDAKAAREQAAREAEARRLREEAERLAHEAAAKAAAEAAAKRETSAPDDLMAQAAATETQAAKVEVSAHATPAAMARVRGDYGSVTTLARVWTFRGLDRATLDLEALRMHLPTDALEKAVRSYISANKPDDKGGTIPQIAGVTIFLDTQVR